MKPNELRIGNLVTVNNPEFWPKLKGVALEVMGVSRCQPLEGYENTDYAVQLIDRNNYNQTYSQFICFIEPILISKKSLEIFNPINVYDLRKDILHDKDHSFIFWFYKNGRIDLRIGGRDFKDHESRKKRYKYIHQFQNLYFDMTTEELNGAH